MITVELADSPEIWPTLSTAPVYMAFEDTIHYGIHAPNSDAEWSLLAPEEGLIYLDDGDQVYSISMLHELRCLNIIRQGIAQKIDGNVTISTPLVRHCLNYVRQMIFCRSNTMLNGFVQGSDSDQPHTLLGINRCNDWTEIYKEVEKNQEEHRRWVASHRHRQKA